MSVNLNLIENAKNFNSATNDETDIELISKAIKDDDIEYIELSKLRSFVDCDGEEQPFNVDTSSADYIAIKESIKTNGQIQPIIVRQMDGLHTGSYQILSGHRRRMACFELGMAKMKAVVVKCDDIKAYDYVVDSNIQRKEVAPIELARIFKFYLNHRKLGTSDTLTTANAIAAKFCIKKKQMYRYVKILAFTEEMQECFNQRRIRMGDVETLYNILVKPCDETDDPLIKKRSLYQQDVLSSYLLSEDEKLLKKHRLSLFENLVNEKPDFTFNDLDEIFLSDRNETNDQKNSTEKTSEIIEAQSTSGNDFYKTIRELYPSVFAGAGTDKETEAILMKVIENYSRLNLYL